MRYLILFMMLVGVFVLGRRNFTFLAGTKIEGPVKTETRPVADFHAITLDMPADVEVRIADQYSVVVHAQESILPKLKTVVENGVLRIYQDGMMWSSGDIRLEVAGPAFDRLTLDGNGTIRVLNFMKADKIIFDLSGSGDIMAPQLQARSVEAIVSGSGTIRTDGSAQDMMIDISGSGDVMAGDLRVENLEANVSGSGSVRCAVNQRIGGSINGSGDILYSGDPKIEVEVSGSGDVQKVGGEN